MTRNLIAILRGVTPNEIESIVEALLEEGVNKIEVPLNSPNPFETIEIMVTKYKGQGVFGAGTVRTTEEVTKLASLGADMVVSPNCNPEVIRATKAANMLSFPGVMTPTECFAALQAGADGLKLFPGELIGPVGLKAVHAVLPAGTGCLAVGGVSVDNLAEWRAAGATGFGIGSALYKPGITADQVSKKARAMTGVYDRVMYRFSGRGKNSKK